MTKPTLLYGLNATLSRLHRTIDDLTDEEARAIPLDGLAPIIWQVGHIALVDTSFARRVDGQSRAPDGYDALFKAGSGGRANYPPLAAVKEVMERGQRTWETIVQTVDPATPIDSDRYSNVGELILFLCYHRGYHIGKMNTLRALLKKPRLFG